MEAVGLLLVHSYTGFYVKNGLRMFSKAPATNAQGYYSQGFVCLEVLGTDAL